MCVAFCFFSSSVDKKKRPGPIIDLSKRASTDLFFFDDEDRASYRPPERRGEGRGKERKGKGRQEGHNCARMSINC